MDTATTPQAPPADLVTVTVNGKEMKLPKGKNLLAALLDSNHYVPHYCWHPSLSIAGNCRLCLVEVEGQPRPNISCNMTCTDGLKIKTEGAMVEDCRKGMMEFLLVNHPLDCPVCDRGGECQLQRYSMEYGFGHARTTDDRRRFPKPDFDPLIDIERNRCIMCTRCVRFMDEVAGQHTLAIVSRGNRNYIGTFENGPVSSVFSGNIVDICPVGCLTSKPYRFIARPWELQQVASTCTLCASGCPTTTWLRDGKVMRVTPPARKYNGNFTIDEDTTKFICNEGRYGNYFANSPDRLMKAFARLDEKTDTTALEVAIQAAKEALRKASTAGPDQVAILCGARATNEEAYLLSRLARTCLGTHQIDGRLAYVTEEAAKAASLALASSDGDLDQLEAKAYGVTLVINAPLLDSVPVIGLKIKEAARKKLTTLALMDSRLDDWMSDLAQAGRITLPSEIAGEVEILAGTKEPDGDVPQSFQALQNLIKGSQTGLIVLGLDTAGGVLNPVLVPAVLKLLKKLGPGWKFLPVFEGRNAKGVFAAGANSDRLPGGDVNSDSARNSAAELWGQVCAQPPKDAQPTSAIEILRRAAEGKIQTLLLHHCGELVHHPMRELIEQALAKTPQVIVIDTFPSWITERASIVLPGSLPFESTGSLTSADGTLQSLTQGNNPPGDAQENWRIILALSGEGGPIARYDSTSKAFQELLLTWKAPKRFPLEDLRLEWPGPESPQRAQPTIFGRKTRPNFKVHGIERPKLNGAGASALAPPSNDSGLQLVWFYGVQGPDHLGSRSVEFDKLRPARQIEISPEEAAKRNLKDGDLVRIEGCRAQDVRVKLNSSLPRGVAYGAANSLGLQIAPDAAGALPRIEISPAPEVKG